jgi:hypothetical protein
LYLSPTGSITLVSLWGKTCCYAHHTLILGLPTCKHHLAKKLTTCLWHSKLSVVCSHNLRIGICLICGGWVWKMMVGGCFVYARELRAVPIWQPPFTLIYLLGIRVTRGEGFTNGGAYSKS